jgi:hypothetical protein
MSLRSLLAGGAAGLQAKFAPLRETMAALPKIARAIEVTKQQLARLNAEPIGGPDLLARARQIVTRDDGDMDKNIVAWLARIATPDLNITRTSPPIVNPHTGEVHPRYLASLLAAGMIARIEPIVATLPARTPLSEREPKRKKLVAQLESLEARYGAIRNALAEVGVMPTSIETIGGIVPAGDKALLPHLAKNVELDAEDEAALLGNDDERA